MASSRCSGKSDTPFAKELSADCILQIGTSSDFVENMSDVAVELDMAEDMLNYILDAQTNSKGVLLLKMWMNKSTSVDVLEGALEKLELWKSLNYLHKAMISKLTN